MNKIRIGILEDLKDVAEMLQQTFNQQEDMACDQVYYNAEDAMHFLPHHLVDILIVDIGLPRASGIDAIWYLKAHCPGTQYCMFTVFEDDDKVFNSLQAGAKGYILKNSTREKIIDSVRDLSNGGSPMSPSIARRILDVFQTKYITPVITEFPLTHREQEILEHLSKGLLYKEIGNLLGITTGTVKQHIHKIYEKLQVSNKTEAINKFKSS